MKTVYPNIPKETKEEAIKLQKEINEVIKKKTNSKEDCWFSFNDKRGEEFKITKNGTILGQFEWECYIEVEKYPFKGSTLEEILEKIQIYDFSKTQ